VEHKILLKSYNDYLGVKEADKEFILYAAGKDAFAPLKKQYIGLGEFYGTCDDQPSMPKTAIKMMTVQKHEYKTTRTTTLGI
jgi:hypothetical protein